MNKEHIPFDVLSEMHDHLLTHGEEERVRAHLRVCAECRGEFEGIGRMIAMVSSLYRLHPVGERDLLRASMRRVRRRQRMYALKRFIPTSAVAAVIILALSVDHISMKQEQAPRDLAIRQPREGARQDFPRFEVRELSGAYDSMRTLSMLKRNNARIITVSDSAIEGEMPANGFEEVAREIHRTRYYGGPSVSMSRSAKMGAGKEAADEKRKDKAMEESKMDAPAPEVEKPKGTMVRFRINIQSQ
ncbi:MAG: zf-HC2 domain-containing protein [Spirochaetes bacterium]|nr:MAG: zf-HC2 domain-containing protein [Spirochaetota bacterium]